MKTLYLRFQWHPRAISCIDLSLFQILIIIIIISGSSMGYHQKRGPLVTYSGIEFHGFSRTSCWNVFFVCYDSQTKNGGGGEASLNFSTTATVEHKFNKKQLSVKHRVRKLLNNYKYEITVKKMTSACIKASIRKVKWQDFWSNSKQDSLLLKKNKTQI